MSRENKSAPLWPLLLVVLVYPFMFERPRGGFLPEETAHVYLARAMVDNFSLRIGDQIKKHGDISAKIPAEGGDAYASVQPGLAALAAIPYAVQKLAYSVVGKEPSIAATVRWLRIVLISLPCALFLLWAYLFLVDRAIRAHPARFALLAFALSAPVWLAATTLSAPLLGAVLLFACLMLFSDDSAWPSGVSFALGGIFCALAIAVSRQAILVAPILGLVAFGRARNPRALVYFVMPVLTVIGLALAYHYVCFGHPLLVEGRVWGLWWPSAAGVWAMFAGPEGLARTAPVLLLAPLGLVVMLLRGEPTAAIMCTLASGLYLLFGSAEPVDPSSLGNGILVAALVFWIWPLARIVEALVSLAGGTLITGVLGVAALLFAALALTTYPFFPDGYANPLRDLALVLFRDGVFAANLGQKIGLSGAYALIPLGLILFAIACAMALGGSPRSDGAARRVASVMLLALSFLWWQLSRSPDTADPRARYRDTLAIERALGADGNAATRLQLRAWRIESTAGRDSREARLARGQAATADGDNARALNAYRK